MNASESGAATVRGFVSGGLLNAWCTRTDRVDVEACLSYLRGVFDVLAGIANRPADHPGSGSAGAVVDCIPDRISVTELRAVLVRYAAGHPDSLGLQASLLVRAALEDNYDCS